MIIFTWLVFSLLVGAIGSNRKIGFGIAFLASLFLSPIVGLIITLFSESKSSIRHKEETKRMIAHQNEMIRRQTETLKKMQDPNYISEEEIEERQKEQLIKEYEERFKKGEITLHQFRKIEKDILSSKNIGIDPKEKSDTEFYIIAFSIIIIVILIIRYAL